MRTRFLLRGALVALVMLCGSLFSQPVTAVDADEVWKAGVARVDITPAGQMWMAGYASRTKPSEGKVQELFAKALAVEDPAGNRLVIITSDLIGIPRELRLWLEQETGRQYQLPPSALLLNASHTHCGPEFRPTKVALPGQDQKRVDQGHQYYEELQKKLLALVGEALGSLQPAKIGYTHGRAGFAMNRRLPTASEPRNAPYPDGPVDHDVPILKVESTTGELRALLFGYACHNTTLAFYQFCGDYAGYAQQDLEATFPGVTALFMTGCGGDQNPQPRGTLELAQHHGSALAMGVKAGLLGPVRPLEGRLTTMLETVTLDFAAAPTRAELEEMAKSGNDYFQRRAARLLQQLEEKGRIEQTYPYTVQVVSFGNGVLLVALAGEVVVDYSLRLKQELQKHGAAVWIAGYSNDVFGYIPSLRVLKEGGYEGGGAMLYTTLPGPFAPSVEERIVGKVIELSEKVLSE